MVSPVDAKSIAPRIGSGYPAIYAEEVKTREKRALGDLFALTQFGVNLTTLPPGCWSAHRHWHENEDEFVYVLEGEVVMIDDQGEHLLTLGMCVGYKAGIANGHHIVNRSDKPARIIEVGTRAPEECAHFSEADMRAAKSGNGLTFTRRDGSVY